jgi:hypothetical protein
LLIGGQPMSDPVGNHARLAGSGTRQNEQRAGRRANGGLLLRIKILEQLARIRCRWFVR